MAQHETHRKNNVAQFTYCQHEQMKACMLEVHMTTTWSPIFAKKKPLTMAQMVYVEVALIVQVD
jgi:hypothetical protein